MTTFITGGTSSIGRVLIQTLNGRGERMRVLVRPTSQIGDLQLSNVEFVPGDVTDTQAVKAGVQGSEKVIHMAAVVGHALPETEWWRVNRDGSRNVLQAALEHGVSSMVQVSSLSVLGHTEPGETADETRPIDTNRYVNLYQKTKHAADEIAQEFASIGLPVKIVYPGFGFGCSHATSHPSMHEMTLLRMAAGKPVAVMGSGRNHLCIAYYNDTVAGILAALEQGTPGEGYILGNDNLTFPEIWQIIAKVLHKKPPDRRIPIRLLKTVSDGIGLIRRKPIFPPDFFDMIGLNWCFSNQKARLLLGWKPLSVEEAMYETWQAYQAKGWILR